MALEIRELRHVLVLAKLGSFARAATALLIQRNARLLDGTTKPGNTKFMRHFDEWRSRDLAAYLRSLSDQAISEQFPVWTGLAYADAKGPEQISR